jgi:peptidoglycan/LPS O-acetylase OafA/YrhL
MSKDYFKPLTGVRAIAAYMVFLHHFNPFKDVESSVLYHFVEELYVGVTLFFVLSGFLIAYRYLDIKNFSIRTYFINRAARIYPMYLILCTLTFIFFQYEKASDNLGLIYLLNITFLKGFSEDFLFTGIAQGWSLTVEETFYISAPLIFFLLQFSKKLLPLIFLVIVMTGIVLVKVFSRLDLYGFFDSYQFMFNYTYFGRSFEFMTGIALAIIYKKNKSIIKGSFFTYTGILLFSVCVVIMSLVKGNAKYSIMLPEGIFINNIILPVSGISLFFYGLLKEDTIVSKFLGSNILIILGKSSYIFYLIHMGVIASFVKRISENMLIFFIIINIISYILFTTLEEPLNKYIRKRFYKNPTF